MPLGLLLKGSGVVIVLVALLHIVLGPGADALLGAQISAASISDPVLDSQNRFYGAAFALYGVLFYLCSTDLVRYMPVLRTIIVVFWFAGAVRLVSVAMVGWPSPLVLALLIVELLLPPVLLVMCRRFELVRIAES